MFSHISKPHVLHNSNNLVTEQVENMGARLGREKTPPGGSNYYAYLTYLNIVHVC